MELLNIDVVPIKSGFHVLLCKNVTNNLLVKGWDTGESIIKQMTEEFITELKSIA